MKVSFLIVLSFFLGLIGYGQSGEVMTVKGPIPSSDLGKTLVHEHVLVDFIGAEKTGNHRWKEDEVVQVVLPFLKEIKNEGVNTFIENTPAYIGRDPELLKSLSHSTGIHFLTNTGYYGASDNKFLPEHAFKESADELSRRWIKEWEEGINGTGIKPGFIKIGVNPGTLSELHQKLIIAAAKTHLKTGLVIASHTGPAQPAFEQLELLLKEGVSPQAFIWVHAQSEKDIKKHVEMAEKGAWISLDGLSEKNMDNYVNMLKNLRDHGFLSHILLSQDAGWYSPGEEKGGGFRAYNTVTSKFVPLLRGRGFSQDEIHKILIENPARAFEIRIRALP